MPWEELRKWLRSYGPEIKRLADRGDRFAQRVYDVYLEACVLPVDHPKNLELRRAIEDYITRDLHLTERYELGSRFGHLVEDEERESGPRIIVPDHIRRH